jgi:ABC-type phosphate/phosphonate transport system ATPase subunit
MGVEFRAVRKVFLDGTVALQGLDLTFDTGEFIVLLGPSGSGKTTACHCSPVWKSRPRARFGSTDRTSPPCRRGSAA